MRMKLGAIAAALLCLALGGCATSRSEITLASPVLASNPAPGAARGAVFIRSVTDQRTFEQAPRDPSIPSLGFEGATQASADLKARAIGRKRNSYGRALGDVLLEDGQTVTSIVRENLAAAFAEAGYRLESDALAPTIPMVIDVEIKKFWAWFQPGFWAITLNTDIEAELKFAGNADTKTISVHTEDKRQAATETAWMEIAQQALTDLRSKVVSQGLGE